MGFRFFFVCVRGMSTKASTYEDKEEFSRNLVYFIRKESYYYFCVFWLRKTDVLQWIAREGAPGQVSNMKGRLEGLRGPRGRTRRGGKEEERERNRKRREEERRAA